MKEFETEEQQQTYEELIESGRRALKMHGPEKTTVSDVTNPVGIAKSTFYLYFDSKADLYLEILSREFDSVRNQLDTELSDLDDPTHRLAVLLRCYREFSEENPFVQQLMANAGPEHLFRKSVSTERFREVQQRGMAGFVPFITDIQQECDGLISEADPSIVLGVMGVIGILTQYEHNFRKFGIEYYDDVQNLLITSLANGLTVPKNYPDV